MPSPTPIVGFGVAVTRFYCVLSRESSSQAIPHLSTKIRSRTANIDTAPSRHIWPIIGPPPQSGSLDISRAKPVKAQPQLENAAPPSTPHQNGVSGDRGPAHRGLTGSPFGLVVGRTLGWCGQLGCAHLSKGLPR